LNAWDVDALERLITERGRFANRDQVAIDELIALSARLHTIHEREGITIPAPQVDIDGGDFELTWIRLKTHRSVSLCFDDGKLTVCWMEGSRGDCVEDDPSDELLAEKMRWIMQDVSAVERGPGDCVGAHESQ